MVFLCFAGTEKERILTQVVETRDLQLFSLCLITFAFFSL